ncbi:unnamed protein product, partial [Heterotrigona itama]
RVSSLTVVGCCQRCTDDPRLVCLSVCLGKSSLRFEEKRCSASLGGDSGGNFF